VPVAAAVSESRGCRRETLYSAPVLFHFAHGTKDQKFLPAIHARAGHEHEPPNPFSCACDFVFFAALKHPLSLCHFSVLDVFVRKKQKAQSNWAFQNRV
jgi:hypothetical protein